MPLERLASLMSEESKGEVSRLALCIDEFHSIFAWKPEPDIHSLMWDLRTIVQHSTRISLLLAGSGVTRKLVSEYQAALFGSIEEIELRPFDLSQEREAIADTFLPHSIRLSMAPTEQFDALLRRASELTGGNPWYLSMLGSAAATVFGERPLTPAMLNHVADEMVAGRVRRADGDIVAKKFYGHLVESLAVCNPREQALAELSLLEVARQTTTDWPWVDAAHILEHEFLVNRAEFAERWNALQALERENIIESKTDAGRRKYRIRIPLVAAALRQDSDVLDAAAYGRLLSHQS